MATPPPPMAGNPYAQQPNPYGPPVGVPPQQSPYGPPQGYAPPLPPQGYAPAAPPQGYAPAPPPYGYAPAPPQQGPYGYPQGGPQPVYDGGPVCRFCGGFPAAAVNFHGHRGMVIVMQFLKTEGPFCLTCGTAVMRDMSAKSMVQGWWGYGSWLFTIIALIRNVFAFNRVKALAPAAPAPGRAQLIPGAPVFRRPEALVVLIPAALLLFLVVSIGWTLLGGN